MPDDSKPARPERTRFVPLDPDYASDDRVVELTRDAEWLFLRCVTLSFRLLSDGRLTLGQIRRECADKADHGEITMMLVELDSAGLLVEAEGGVWLLPGYVKNNRTADEVAAAQLKKKVGGQLGRHKRYHKDKPVDDCLFCEHPGQGFSSVLAIAGSRCGLATSGVVAKPDQGVVAKPLPDTDTDTDTDTDADSLFHVSANPRAASADALKQTKGRISADWEPDPRTLVELRERNVPAQVISDSVGEFINHHLGHGTLAVDFDRLFVGWVQVRMRSKQHPAAATTAGGDRRVAHISHRPIDTNQFNHHGSDQ